MRIQQPRLLDKEDRQSFTSIALIDEMTGAGNEEKETEKNEGKTRSVDMRPLRLHSGRQV
jgi:hypothetical protein